MKISWIWLTSHPSKLDDPQTAYQQARETEHLNAYQLIPGIDVITSPDVTKPRMNHSEWVSV